jgi:RecA/RadA recombinase
MATKTEEKPSEDKLVAARNKNLDLAIQQIAKDYGDGAIMRLGDEKIVDIEVIPTGNILIDRALGVGGFPRGRVVEVFGPESSGKTTLTLTVIAQAQKRGGLAAFIDVEHALDPVRLERLARQRPAKRIAIVGCQTVTHRAMRGGGASIAHLHAVATPAAHDQACHKRRAIANRAQRIGMGAVRIETGHVAFVLLPGARGRRMSVYQHVVILA